MADVEAAAKLLQIAAVVARAVQAVLVVVGEDELKDGDLRVAHDLRVRVDFHAFPDFGRARCHEAAIARDLDGADAAASFDALIGVVAEMRDVDVHLACGVDDLRALGDFDGNVVDRQMYEFSFFCH